ncbi:MAG: nicotinate (nicotinamide) nucleotide adenylyltransferase [archaeon]
MKIGLFGGSFDPVHSGHLIAAEKVLEKGLCDKIWFMPCYQNPLKKKLSDAIHRKKMIELAIKGKKGFELNELELNKKKITYSIDSVKELKKMFPEDTFYFIIAEKGLNEFHKWKNHVELLKEVKFIIVSVFDSAKIPDVVKKHHPILVQPSLSSNLSSTMIRKGLKEQKDVSVFLPEKVFEYIKENKLYGFE